MLPTAQRGEQRRGGGRGGGDARGRGISLPDNALSFLDSGRHLLVVEYLHALPMAPPAHVKAAEIHSIPSKSRYYFNWIEREFTLTQFTVGIQPTQQLVLQLDGVRRLTYYFNGIEREFRLLIQLESNRCNIWCSNWTECEDVKQNYKARANQGKGRSLRTFFVAKGKCSKSDVLGPVETSFGPVKFFAQITRVLHG